MRIQDFRSLQPKTQEDLRRKAVKAVLAGRTRQEVGDLFGVSGKSVGVWVNNYLENGAKSLKANKRGRPKGGGRLLPWQAAQIAKAVEDKNPDQLKLPFYLWTRQAVAQLIEKRFDVKVSVWTVGRYLRRWGFTPQKPVRKAFEQNPEQVQWWLEEYYPAVRRLAKRERAKIYWGDESGVRSDHTVGRTFGRKGKTPVVPGTGQRFKCNMISAITNQGNLNFMVFTERFRANVFISFLKRLVKQNNGKVFLIVDGHPVHRSKAVKDWLEANEKHLRMFFLPGYSPELNPDEMLNQDVKTNAVGRKRPHVLSEMISNVRRFLRSRQRQPNRVKKYFQEKHVQYAAI
jgi:transposase